MSSRKIHEETYNALLQVPFIRKIMDTNKRLKKENKILKTLIYSMPEFRCKCNITEDIPIHIKTEEGTIPIQCEPLTENDEVVYVADPEVKKINIVYEIEENEDDDAQAEEEDDDEAQAGEEEEDDESGE